MAESEVVVQAPKATVYVERSIQVRQYESLKVGIHFPVELPLFDIEDDDATTEGYAKEVNDAIKGAFFTAKAHVYEQAGVKFEDKDGVLVEMISAKFEGTAEVVPTPPRPTAAPAPSPASSGERPCPECGKPMWDNAEKKAKGEIKPNAPDFKCKDKSCKGIIWPVKSR